MNDARVEKKTKVINVNVSRDVVVYIIFPSSSTLFAQVDEDVTPQVTTESR